MNAAANGNPRADGGRPGARESRQQVSPAQYITDDMREQRIARLNFELVNAPTRELRRVAWQALQREVLSRSAEQVRSMERERGLAMQEALR